MPRDVDSKSEATHDDYPRILGRLAQVHGKFVLWAQQFPNRRPAAAVVRVLDALQLLAIGSPDFVSTTAKLEALVAAHQLKPGAPSPAYDGILDELAEVERDLDNWAEHFSGDMRARPLARLLGVLRRVAKSDSARAAADLDSAVVTLKMANPGRDE